MRKLILAVLGALTLAGCMSTMQGAYDDRARHDCERENRGSDRINC